MHLHSFDPAAANGRAQTSTPSSDSSVRSVRLVWHDPQTGEELRIAMRACPELLTQLAAEGFFPEDERKRSAG